MKRFNSVFVLLSLLLFGSLYTMGHGGEDHGDEKPKTVATEKGTILHTSRLGAYEITLKYPSLEPDAATTARFFITKFETNEPAENAAPAIEIESATGAVTEATIEKTDAAGSFVVKIPALPEGVYTIRAKLTYAGETDTATFSGVEIKTPSTPAESGISWLRSLLIAFLFAVVLAMFAALVYFVWQFAGGKTVERSAMKKETASV